MGLNETGGKQAENRNIRTKTYCIARRIDTTDTSKSPRGIRGFQLNEGNFSDWKVQGKLGGYTK